MSLAEYDLTGQVALITGAGRGVGRGIALVLAQAGADVVLAARTLSELEAVAQEVRSLGRKAIPVQTDITRPTQVEHLVQEALANFGKVDILVNNAGTAVVKPLVPLPGFHPPGGEAIPNFFAPTSDEEWRKVVDTNLSAAVYCLRAVGPHMLERRHGKVINISSINAVRSADYRFSYDVTKAALVQLTRSVAREWARYNVQVNAMGLGYVHTELTSEIFRDSRLAERTLRQVPLGRTAQPREAGLLAVYLASAASDYMTGQTIFLDGGFLT